MHISFGGSVGRLVPMFMITQIASVTVLVGIFGLITQYIVLWMMGYPSKIYRKSLGEEITVEQVHQKKATQAVVRRRPPAVRHCCSPLLCTLLPAAVLMA